MFYFNIILVLTLNYTTKAFFIYWLISVWEELHLVLHEGVEECKRNLSIASGPCTLEVVHNETVGRVALGAGPYVLCSQRGHLTPVRHLAHTQAVTLLHGLSQRQCLKVQLLLTYKVQITEIVYIKEQDLRTVRVHPSDFHRMTFIDFLNYILLPIPIPHKKYGY